MKAALTLALMGLASCNSEKLAAPYTLYRDSPMLVSARIHFASFNVHAEELPTSIGSFNQDNCKMTADLLNENVARLNNGKHPGWFWCEQGPFKP